MPPRAAPRLSRAHARPCAAARQLQTSLDAPRQEQDGAALVQSPAQLYDVAMRQVADSHGLMVRCACVRVAFLVSRPTEALSPPLQHRFRQEFVSIFLRGPPRTKKERVAKEDAVAAQLMETLRVR